MEYLFKFLSFFKLTEYNKLNLSNIAVIIILYKLTKAPVQSLTDTAPLFVALMAHHADQIINKGKS